jgi:hypothetical protein
LSKLAIDLGYSSTKVQYEGKLYKIPTAVSYAGSSSLDYGDNNHYEFEGEKYVIGQPAENSFVTTDYKFLHMFAPVIIYHVCKVIGIPLTEPVNISTGLAVSDWGKRAEFKERIESFTDINGDKVKFVIQNIVPQGAGVYYDFKKLVDSDVDQKSVYLIDIGYNTINTLFFDNGKPVREKAAAHVGSGVTTIIKDFTKWLEQQYNLPFSEQEALKIYVKKRFIYQGLEQPDVVNKINELKKRFVSQLFKSILVQEKKLLATSDVVVIAGGGVYLLNDVPFPPNVKFVADPYEFSNVRGYAQFI